MGAKQKRKRKNLVGVSMGEASLKVCTWDQAGLTWKMVEVWEVGIMGGFRKPKSAKSVWNADDSKME